MTGDVACQRWSPGGQPSWRRTSEGGFDPDRYGVAELDEATAKAYVTDRHYSGSYPAAAQRYGLFDLAGEDGPVLAGAAVLSIPARPQVLTNVFPHLEPYAESLELGRFVLDDAVPANAESWTLGQVARLAAAKGTRGLVMFSDPVERRRADGTVVLPGHTGVIYQASNAAYLGRGTARTLVLLPDGQVLSARAMQKIRAQDQGHEYAERQLIELGARPLRAGEQPASWLAGALDDVGAVRVRHRGNHRYAWPVGGRRERARVLIAGERLPYPKQPDVALAA